MTSSLDSDNEYDWRFAASVLGLAAALCARFAFGFDWVSAGILFFPAWGLAGRILANDGYGIAKYCAMLLFFPIVRQVSSVATFELLSRMASPGKSFGHTAITIARACVATLVSVAAYWAAALVACLFGHFRMPGTLHKCIACAMEVSARVLLFFGGIALVRHCDGTFFAMSGTMKIAIAILLAAGVVFSVIRVFRGPQPSFGGQVTGGRHTPAKQSTRLSDVIGMDEAKEQIRLRLLEPVRNPRKASKYGLSVGGGVLLYGPPGTGKTMLARAVAGELDLPFFMITAADVFGKYVGESERNMRAVFAEARRHKLSVLFIDELETLFPNRSENVHETTRKVISVILQELDGLDKKGNPILLLGATNVPWMVDEAFLRPGRFDVKIFVGLPDAQTRRKMLETAFRKGGIPVEAGLPEFMAERTANYSGADLNGVMDRLRQLAYAAGAKSYGRDMAEKAIASVSPTATGDILDKIQEWESRAMPSNSRNSGSSGVLISARPDVRLADVAGMEAAKEEIRMRLIEPIRNATLANHYGLRVGGGMLLYGPPGTGKTFMARAVAGELGLPFYSISSADVFGKYVGESERNLKRIFRDIRKNKLAVVFIDELETLFPKRTAEVHETTRKVIALLLQELDGLDAGRNPILLLGATNVPWMVDEAFLRPGRFDVCIYVGPPDLAARRQMAMRAFESGAVPYEVGLDEYVAQRTEGFSGADLNGLFERLRQTAFRKRLRHYAKADIEEVLSGVSPSLNGELVERIKKWEASR